MLSQFFLGQVNKLDNRIKMPKINQDELNSLIIPLPPLVEQHRIVAKVDALMQLCDQLEGQITDTKLQ
jgi:type I restriction enzyme, S subunit